MCVCVGGGDLLNANECNTMCVCLYERVLKDAVVFATALTACGQSTDTGCLQVYIYMYVCSCPKLVLLMYFIHACKHILFVLILIQFSFVESYIYRH